MSVIDASAWVSLMVGEDVHHPASRRWFADRAAQGGPFVIPAHALAEVGGAIARRRQRAADGDAALALLLRFPGLRVVAVDARLAWRAASLATQGRMRGADAIYVALAELLGLPLVTWDREQTERAADWVAVRRPDGGG